jgi:hypothetical protein
MIFPTRYGAARNGIGSGHAKSATTSWGYEDGPWKAPGPPLLVAADFLKRILDKQYF